MSADTDTEADSPKKRGRIPQSEWPGILERHRNGTTLSAIAREFDCTPSAISYIVKKAEAATHDTKMTAETGQLAFENTADSRGSDVHAPSPSALSTASDMVNTAAAPQKMPPSLAHQTTAVRPAQGPTSGSAPERPTTAERPTPERAVAERTLERIPALERMPERAMIERSAGDRMGEAYSSPPSRASAGGRPLVLGDPRPGAGRNFEGRGFESRTLGLRSPDARARDPRSIDSNGSGRDSLGRDGSEDARHMTTAPDPTTSRPTLGIAVPAPAAAAAIVAPPSATPVAPLPTTAASTTTAPGGTPGAPPPVDVVEGRLRETAKACLSAYRAWRQAPGETSMQGLHDSVHELRKVLARVEIDLSASRRDDAVLRPIPIPSHRATRRP